MKRVIAFGAFDPLTEGQKDFIRQAKQLGDYLIVVVAHDSAIRAHKGREPQHSEEERMQAVRELKLADEVILGRKTANRYHVMTEVDFDVVALGYNQMPSDDEVRTELEHMGKYNVEIVRCKEYTGKDAKDPKTPKMSKKVLISVVVVAVIVVLGLLLALASAGRSNKNAADNTPQKVRLEVVSTLPT